MQGILRVVFPVGVAGGILQQLFDALVDQSPRVFGEVGILFAGPGLVRRGGTGSTDDLWS